MSGIAYLFHDLSKAITWENQNSSGAGWSCEWEVSNVGIGILFQCQTSHKIVKIISSKGSYPSSNNCKIEQSTDSAIGTCKFRAWINYAMVVLPSPNLLFWTHK